MRRPGRGAPRARGPDGERSREAPEPPAPGTGIVRSAMEGLAVSVRFLTILPVPGGTDTHRGLPWAPAFFPLVGLVVGLAVALVLAAPLPALPRAALALLVWIVLTGGLHEDGWMDVLDGVFAPVRPQDRLEILKDPRVGAHGATGGGALLLIRFAALAAVAPAAAPVAALLGRSAMALSLATAPPARRTGLGAQFATHPRGIEASVGAFALLLFLGDWAGWGRIGLATLFAGIAAVTWSWFLVRRLGGLTGDGHGAVGYLAEVAALLAFLPLTDVPS